jgi:hypothetical protein
MLQGFSYRSKVTTGKTSTSKNFDTSDVRTVSVFIQVMFHIYQVITDIESTAEIGDRIQEEYKYRDQEIDHPSPGSVPR